ncbi:MAG: carbamoyltransferase, partial [Nanoarchaeota archaeon]|nr:carbamoyltransferase [Nanoarchaeota archaeon]
MNIVGITALTHDSGAALVSDSRIEYAINEERFNRVKLTGGWPELSYKYILDKLKNKEIDYVAVSDLGEKEFLRRSKGLMLDKSLFCSNPYYSAKTWMMMLRWKIRTYLLFKEQQEKLKRKIGKKFIKVEHHLTHAASAYLGSGMKKCLIVTADNHGDYLTTGVYLGDNGNIKKIHDVRWPHSTGFFYGAVTKALGFKPWRHEGKITGLAAYGFVNLRLYEKMKKFIWFEDGEIKTKCLLSMSERVKRLKKNYKREDIAAVCQKIFEEVICGYISYWKDKLGMDKVALAGGSFANVKLNQRIHELGFKEIFIFPHMGDGGTGAGAALYVGMIKEGIKPYYLEDSYLGPDFSEDEIKKELEKEKVKHKKCSDIEGDVAELLAKGKVVARFDRRMEFGPRALGARSILYQATDPSVNDWLNKQLFRSDFMPFAPVTIERFASKYYKNFEGGRHAAKFMTLCFDCTDKMKEESPAVVHVDGTARPQTINKQINKSYFRIVDEYRKITGIPTIVNTSFNMHEEPIVCTPYDA